MGKIPKRVGARNLELWVFLRYYCLEIEVRYTAGKTSVRTPSVVLFGIPLLLNLTVCELEYRRQGAVKVWKSSALVALAYVRPKFRKPKQRIPLSCSHPSYRVRLCLKKKGGGREYKLNKKWLLGQIYKLYTVKLFVHFFNEAQ